MCVSECDLRARFHLSSPPPPPSSLQELEDTLLLDEVKDGTTPSLLVNLYCGLLNGIVDKEVT